MKYIAKMMLALLASVTLVIPAYAWDFSASGSMEATWESIHQQKLIKMLMQLHQQILGVLVVS